MGWVFWCPKWFYPAFDDPAQNDRLLSNCFYRIKFYYDGRDKEKFLAILLSQRCCHFLLLLSQPLKKQFFRFVFCKVAFQRHEWPFNRNYILVNSLRFVIGQLLGNILPSVCVIGRFHSYLKGTSLVSLERPPFFNDFMTTILSLYSHFRIMKVFHSIWPWRIWVFSSSKTAQKSTLSLGPRSESSASKGRSISSSFIPRDM